MARHCQACGGWDNHRLMCPDGKGRVAPPPGTVEPVKIPVISRPWYEDDDRMLAKCFDSGMSFQAIVQKMGRTESSVRTRLALLGRGHSEKLAAAAPRACLDRDARPGLPTILFRLVYGTEQVSMSRQGLHSILDYFKMEQSSLGIDPFDLAQPYIEKDFNPIDVLSSPQNGSTYRLYQRSVPTTP